jgi:hypothetical protein
LQTLATVDFQGAAAQSTTFLAAPCTIITSQLPTTKWHDHLGDPTVADAILG